MPSSAGKKNPGIVLVRQKRKFDGPDGPKKKKTFLGRCKRLWTSMLELDDSKPFRSAVDKRKYPDYHRVVRYDINLHKIGVKIDTGHYANPNDFANDVKLMIDNWSNYIKDPSLPVYGQITRFKWWCQGELDQILQDWTNHQAKKKRVTEEYMVKSVTLPSAIPTPPHRMNLAPKDAANNMQPVSTSTTTGSTQSLTNTTATTTTATTQSNSMRPVENTGQSSASGAAAALAATRSFIRHRGSNILDNLSPNLRQPAEDMAAHIAKIKKLLKAQSSSRVPMPNSRGQTSRPTSGQTALKPKPTSTPTALSMPRPTFLKKAPQRSSSSTSQGNISERLLHERTSEAEQRHSSTSQGNITGRLSHGRTSEAEQHHSSTSQGNITGRLLHGRTSEAEQRHSSTSQATPAPKATRLPTGLSSVTARPSPGQTATPPSNVPPRISTPSNCQTEEQLVPLVKLSIKDAEVWYGDFRDRPQEPVCFTDLGLDFPVKTRSKELTFRIEADDIVRSCGYFHKPDKTVIFLFLMPGCTERLRNCLSAAGISRRPSSQIVLFCAKLPVSIMGRLLHLFWILSRSSVFGQLFSELDEKAYDILMRGMSDQPPATGQTMPENSRPTSAAVAGERSMSTSKKLLGNWKNSTRQQRRLQRARNHRSRAHRFPDQPPPGPPYARGPEQNPQWQSMPGPLNSDQPPWMSRGQSGPPPFAPYAPYPSFPPYPSTPYYGPTADPHSYPERGFGQDCRNSFGNHDSAERAYNSGDAYVEDDDYDNFSQHWDRGEGDGRRSNGPSDDWEETTYSGGPTLNGQTSNSEIDEQVYGEDAGGWQPRSDEAGNLEGENEELIQFIQGSEHPSHHTTPVNDDTFLSNVPPSRDHQENGSLQNSEQQVDEQFTHSYEANANGEQNVVNQSDSCEAIQITDNSQDTNVACEEIQNTDISQDTCVTPHHGEASSSVRVDCVAEFLQAVTALEEMNSSVEVGGAADDSSDNPHHSDNDDGDIIIMSDTEEEKGKDTSKEEVHFVSRCKDLMIAEAEVNTKCPITQKVMVYPVLNRHCNHCYDREGARQLTINRKDKARCPVPGCINQKPLIMDDLIFNSALHHYILSQGADPKK